MKNWWPFAVSVSVLALDRATKHLIETRVQAWETIRVIPGLFQIIHTRNTGIAFGVFSESNKNGLLVVFSFAVLCAVIGLLWSVCRRPSREHWTLGAALGFVLGGAMGNLYDRIVFGSVTDFLDFYRGQSHFPIFNVADSAISVGAALLLINLWMVRK